MPWKEGPRAGAVSAIALVLAIAGGAPGTGYAQVPVAPGRDAIANRAAAWTRLSVLLPNAAPRTAWAEDGALYYLGVPPGIALAAPRRDPGRPEVAALAFLSENAVLFGADDAAFGFRIERTNDRGTRRFVRVQQTAHGLPVFGGEMIVQLDPADAIEAVTGNVARGTFPYPAAAGRPGLDATAASAAARALAASRGVTSGLEVGEPSLTWFAPQVLRESGPVTLAWSVEVKDPSSPTFHHRWLLDAHDGSLLREFPLVCAAVSRRVFDMRSDTLLNPIPLVRGEGGPATGIADADDAYDMMGDTYNFYWSRHGRDGVNGSGATHQMVVRVCTTGPEASCPWGNATGGSTDMWFGLGMVEDDVIAHEWTHGVTAYESALIYANESGAINESFSDIWGEFVDLTNGRGDDSPGVRWQVGEDLAGPALPGPIRDMKDPRRAGHPDRRNSPYYYTGMADAGGVHTNSGVNNKLCYLLTDGDTFNGRTIYGVGINRVAALYYEAQTNLLYSSSGWAALAVALQQAAVNLGWNDADQLNLYRGLLAVEIATPQDLWVDWNSSCPLQVGDPNCFYPVGPFENVLNGQAGAHPGDLLHVRAGNYYGPHLLTKPLKYQAEGGVVTIGP